MKLPERCTECQFARMDDDWHPCLVGCSLNVGLATNKRDVHRHMYCPLPISQDGQSVDMDALESYIQTHQQQSLAHNQGGAWSINYD